MASGTFIDRAIRNEFADISEALDDAIDSWHNQLQQTAPLHEWLGMSWEEYRRWCQHPSEPDEIIAARRKSVSG